MRQCEGWGDALTIDEYERLLRRYERREAREARKASNGAGRKDRLTRAEARPDLATAWGLPRHRVGLALVQLLPSVQEMRVAARRHLDETLGLADLGVRLGPVEISGQLPPAKVKLAAVDPSSRGVKYWLFVGFQLAVRVGAFRGKIRIDKDETGWRCRSDSISRKAIEDATRRSTQRIVVLTLADQRVAGKILRAIRGQVESAEVWTQEDWDRHQADSVLGALHAEGRIRRASKAEQRAMRRELKALGAGAETRFER